MNESVKGKKINVVLWDIEHINQNIVEIGAIETQSKNCFHSFVKANTSGIKKKGSTDQ